MTHSEFIESLGGPTKLANMLGFGKNGAARVCNWKVRGIPASVLVANQWLLKEINKAKKKT